MGKDIDYENLYLLQDKVLQVVSSLNNEFYLTGGTALHRFYYDARYSDDLDFFVTNGISFSEDVKEIIAELRQNHQVDINVFVKDFSRIIIDDFLQVDFVNDRVYREGKSIAFDGIRVDNKINILTNKITAIVDRDEEKDIFDLMCICYYEDFDWKNILEISNKKAIVEKDVLIYRLKSFPIKWLDRIKKIKDIVIKRDDIEKLCSDIFEGKNNSLHKIETYL